MPESPEDLATRTRALQIQDNEDILRKANETLKKSKSDIKAQRTRVVALLKLDRFDDAVLACEGAGDAFVKEAALEYAYALYKAGKLDKAYEVASSTGEDRGLMHLAAQASYRLETFDKTSEIYSTLASSAEAANEEYDIRLNQAALDAQLQWSGRGDLAKSKKPQKEDLQAFESAFNAACGCIARGEYRQAEVLLDRAKRLCSESEDLSDDEKKNEILPILVQQVYLYSLLGKKEEASKLCQSFDINNIGDISVRKLAQINSLAINQLDNPYLAVRLFHAPPHPPPKDVPFQYQETILRQNSLALDLGALKHAGVAKTTASKLSSATPTVSPSITTLSVINAAAVAKNEVGKQALKSILPLMEKRPTDIGLLLTIIQLYVLTNNIPTAISLLETFFDRLKKASTPAHQDVHFAPGLVRVAVSLYSSQGRKNQAKSLLENAASYWRSRKNTDSHTPLHTDLLCAAGSALLESHDKDDASSAVDIFSNLHDIDPSDTLATAGLVAALSTAAPSKLTSELTSAVTPASKLIASIDAAALEDAGVPNAPTPIASDARKRTAGDAKDKPVKKRKLAKSRMPKDYVEGKQLDPERWLPMRDRSYWKPKGKKGKARAAGLTQGGVVEEKEKDKVESKVVTGGGGAQKKKKKGKK